jgi:imidazole glycerol-phosphate synthase subunit HisH
MNAPEVIVVDYGVGNLLSVCRGLEYCGAKVVMSSNPNQILSAERVVLPGVGAFSNAMAALDRLDLIDVIREVARQQKPLLGICLGMQLLLDESEEFGMTHGLGLISGRIIPVPSKTNLGTMQKIPHIGWAPLRPSPANSNWADTVLMDNCRGDAMYFVHSYMASGLCPSDLVADCEYGGHMIPAVIRRGNTTGCQFHPEKSGEAGLKILRNFVRQ